MQTLVLNPIQNYKLKMLNWYLMMKKNAAAARRASDQLKIGAQRLFESAGKEEKNGKDFLSLQDMINLY